MNGKQRIAQAMQHRQPDRVPVMCQLSLGHYFLNAGLPPHRIWFTSEGFAEALVKLQQRYRVDGKIIDGTSSKQQGGSLNNEVVLNDDWIPGPSREDRERARTLRASRSVCKVSEVSAAPSEYLYRNGS